MVFFVPKMLRITSILGSESAGPASKRANAGPLPIPLPISPCTIGTSVNVAKYIKAPKNEAKRFENIEFPPTIVETHWLGIIPSCKGLPKAKPAINTPMKSSGTICFVKSQV